MAPDVGLNVAGFPQPVPPYAVGGGEVSSIKESDFVKNTNLGRSEAKEQNNFILPFDLIRNNVDVALAGSIRDIAGEWRTLLEDVQLIQILQKMVGKKGDKGSLGQLLRNVGNSFSDVSDGKAGIDAIIQSLTGFTVGLQSLYDDVSSLQEMISDKIGAVIVEINDILGNLAKINNKISENSANGFHDRLSSDADEIIDELAGLIDFSAFKRKDGSISLFSKSGFFLVDSVAATLDKDEDAIINTGQQRKDQNLASIFSRGRLASLLGTQRSTLPEFQFQLDMLANLFQSRINLVSNRVLSGSEARHKYEGTRLLGDSAHHRIRLVGGDTVLTLLSTGGQILAQTSLLYEIKRYRMLVGLPACEYYPLPSIAMTLTHWLNECLGTEGEKYSVFSRDNGLRVNLPRDVNLCFCDKRSNVLQSGLSEDSQKPLGLQGMLVILDAAGNRMALEGDGSCGTIQPTDNLVSICDRLNDLVLVTASLVPSKKGSSLQISSAIGSDLVVQPEQENLNLVKKFNILPFSDSTCDDVSIHHVTVKSGRNWQSRPVDPKYQLPATGLFLLEDESGNVFFSTILESGWNLEEIADHLQPLLQQHRIDVMSVYVGNTMVLRINADAKDSFSIPFFPDSVISKPTRNFSANGGELVIYSGSRLFLREKIARGSNLSEVFHIISSARKNPEVAFFDVRWYEFDGLQAIELIMDDPASFRISGDATGHGDGFLDFSINVRDQLGLSLPGNRIVSGFANFFGLNDLLVAGNITTGIARTLQVHPRLAENFVNQKIFSVFSEALQEKFNVPDKGSQSLTDYCDNIVELIHNSCEQKKNEAFSKEALHGQLILQKHKLPDLTMIKRMNELSIFKLAYEDCSRLVASIPKLSVNLEAGFC